jgi:hypothetical protein
MHPQECAELRTASQPADPLNDDFMMDSATTRAICGGVSNMCLWRWTRDPRVRFPAPDLVINGRRYWKVTTIRRWKAERVAKQAA